MDFRQISDFFGGSIFPDEYRTDLFETKKRIIELQASLSASSPARDRADVRLLHAIFSSITGDISTFELLINKVRAIADETDDKALSLRCSVYSQYRLSLRKVPPPLDFWSDIHTDTRIIERIHLDLEGAESERRELDSEIDRYFGLGGIESLESVVLLQRWKLVSWMWIVGFHRHPSYQVPDTRKSLKRSWALSFSSGDIYGTSHIYKAENLGLRTTAAYMKRLNARYYFAGGSDKAKKSVTELNKACVEPEDAIGAANCKMMEVDHLLSLPFTSPIAFNLMPFASGIGWDNPVWDQGNSERSMPRDSAAEGGYEEALRLFEKGKSRRGMAAINLRIASVNIAKCLDYLANMQAHPLVSFAKTLESADSHLSEAVSLFELDGPNLQIAATHKLLVQILQGNEDLGTNDQAMLLKAAQIGRWGAEKKNPGISRFAGLLLLRAGRKIFTPRDNAKMAQKCCACSRAIFLALQEPMLEVRAVAAQAQLHQKLGNLAVARNYISTGHDVLLRTLQWLDSIIPNRSTDTEDLRYFRFKRVDDFDKCANSILQGDARLLQWKAQRKTLMGGSHLEAMTDAFQREGLKALLATSKSSNQRDSEGGLSNITDRFLQSVSVSSKAWEKLDHEFDVKFRKRRDAVVQHVDIDRGDDILQQIVAFKPDRDDGWLENLIRTTQVVALLLLGRSEEARRMIPQIVPTMFGGKSQSLAKDLRNFDLVFTQATLMEAQHAIGLCFMGQDWNLGEIVLKRAVELHPNFFEEVQLSADVKSWQTMVWIAAIERNNRRFKSAFTWYIKALNIVEGKRAILADVQDRREILASIHANEIFFGLAAVSIKLSNLDGNEVFKEITGSWKFGGPDWMDQALVFLEQGRSRALLDLMALDGSSKEFREWLYHQRQAELNPGESFATTLATSTMEADLFQIEDELSHGRGTMDLTGILTELKITDGPSCGSHLYQVIPENTVAVHINPAREGTLILYVTRLGIEVVHHGTVTDIDINRHVLGFLKMFRHCSDPEDRPSADKYQKFINFLSEAIIQPAEALLRSKSHVIFIPFQSLNKFPFSTLSLDGEPIFLSKQISMCPSLRILQHLVCRTEAQRSNRTSSRNASVIFKAPASPPAGSSDLNLSAAAALAASTLLKCDAKPAHLVSNDEFASTFERSDVMFIATHGNDGVKAIPSAWTAWESCLSLRDDYRVLDLLKLDCHAALVIFEACVSGLVEDTVGNDVLGFSHTVLSSGANSFIGALWEISDQASAFLMSFLFRNLARDGSRFSLAQCLQAAQVELYHASKQKLVDVLTSFDEQCASVGENVLTSGEVKAIRKALEYAKQDLDDEEDSEPIYAHPFFWAPFVLVGHGMQHCP